MGGKIGVLERSLPLVCRVSTATDPNGPSAYRVNLSAECLDVNARSSASPTCTRR
jgi:hypothetical protein